MGIILCPEWRSRGVATKALQLVLEHVFSQPNVHRVQAQLIDCYKNVQALTLFTRMGFSHEGTRRQGFYCPLTTEWRDVTTLALLVTDWFIHLRDRDGFQSAPKSLWDALFMRHQREREELLRWEDRRPRRSSSLETLRGGAATPVPLRPQELDASDSDDVEAASEGELSSVERQKRKRSENGGNGLPAKVRDAYDASSSENESDYESAVEGSPWKRARSRAGIPSSADLSTPASLLLSNGPDSNLDPSYGNIRTLDNQLGEGPSASPGPSSISSPTSLGPTSGNVLPAPPRMRSISLSPDLDLGSPATSPLDTESEYEDLGGYASSNTESSSPSGSWDMMSNASERSPSP
ncbi:hypothetical protein NP233_g12032 [Leucocoprinus birnbaumii]|uniref:N-acetyltransferase domain-containing protein n=1 Tax=Leucocoprinus birnbaumii TaxID=56174 RepID=A0AAD5VFU9_9AGAR|nr:hypothetical protein NP233_g12032 [Leucocoprinus birnbaumii]